MSRKILFSVFLIFLFSLSLFFLSTCKKDPISSAPLTAVATNQIGPDGGKLETADFSLEVPTGSFTDETTLNLYISSDPSSFGDNGVSQSFLVEGIPDVFDKPIGLAIKYSGELGDSSYIAIGETADDFFTGDSSVVHRFISIKDSAGFLVGKIKPRIKSDLNIGIMKSRDFDLVGNIFQAITKYGAVTTNNEHFEISYPKTLYSEGIVEEFGDLLEELHDKIKNEFDLNFYFKDEEWCNSRNVSHPCWIWPVPINIKNVENKIIGGLNKSKDPITRYGPYINIDGTLLGSSHDSEARILLGKDLFALRMLTMKYDTYFYNERKWLAWATYEWLEGFFGNDTDPQIPTNFEGNELSPFNGLQFGNFIGDSYGQGMTSMIKYLVDKKILALNKIGDIFNTIHEQNIHPVTALLSSVNALVADWWPDYIENLIDGKIYNIDSSVFLNSNFIYGTWPINNEDDNIKIFSASDEGIVPYPDLSAKMFIVNLNYSGIDESASLYLDSYRSNAANNDGIATLVFGVNSSNTLQHLTTAKNSATVLPKKLKEYFDEDIRQFLVVVVNSTHNGTDYLGITDVELILEVKEEEPTLYTTCEVEVNYRGQLHYVTEYDSPNLADSDETYWTNWGFTFPANSSGSFMGNTFTYEYNRVEDSNNTRDIHFTLTISEDKSEIINIDYIDNSISGGNAGKSSASYIHNLVSIPFEKMDASNNEATYYIGEEQTCNSITYVKFDYENEIFDVLTNTRDLVDRDCDENSFIRVKLK